MSTASQIVLEVITGGKASVRLMRVTDTIPPLEIGFDRLGKLDYDWVWVVERRGRIEGVLVAAPCHGIAMIYRLALVEGAPLSSLTKLLRGFLTALREREMRGFMTMLDPENDTQFKLMHIVEMAGGTRVGGKHILMACATPREGI